MCGAYTGEYEETADLMNDLMMLIEARDCYNETYFMSEYRRMTNRISELLGVKV